MEVKKIKLLLIGNDQKDVSLIQKMLSEVKNVKYNLKYKEQFFLGRKQNALNGVDVILLDLSLPERKELDIFNDLCAKTREMPIIVLCDLEDEELGRMAIREGAEDYLVKENLNSNLLSRSIRYCIEIKKAENVQLRLTDYLSKRIKELNCLYTISDLIGKYDISQIEILQVVVDLIPPTWQYPKTACARIILDGKEIKSYNFKETVWKQTADILVQGERIGGIEVCYLEEKPECDEGPFQNEERSLINVIAKSMGETIERKKAKEALRESEAKYRNLVERANDGIVIIQNGMVRYANPRLLELAGCTFDDILDTPFTDYVHPDEVTKLVDQYIRRMDGEKVEELYETVLKRKDGTDICAEINAGLISYKGKSADLIFIHDITERKLAEEKLNNTMNELKRSNEELENFAYVVSHDLQEPLRMINTYLQLLEHRYKGKLDEDANEFIRYAVDGATRGYALINDLLTYSRVGTHGKAFEPIDCTKALNQALNNLEVAIKESRAVITHDPLPIVMGDDIQISQIYQNLINNSIKFHNEKPPKVHVKAEEKGNEWLFSIEDNGIGIDPKYADKIFTIFQRLHKKNEYPGSGIGLAVCKKMVERHGGKIWVESEPGRGSTFYFTIPNIEGEQP